MIQKVHFPSSLEYIIFQSDIYYIGAISFCGTLFGLSKTTIFFQITTEVPVMNLKTIILSLLLQTLIIGTAQAGRLYLSVAASMTDAFKELLGRFEIEHPQIKILPNFASSGSLAKQIEQGAPADIYISANPRWMRYLLEKGSIKPGSERIFAYNSLVFIGNSTKMDLNLESLVQFERIALGVPQSVPAGQYARQAMTAAGVYEELERTRKLVMAKDVRQALLYADRGEVDGAFVYATDAALAKRARILFVVPQKLYDRVSYPLALTRAGAAKESARSFYDFMGSLEAREVLTRFGFQAVH